MKIVATLIIQPGEKGEPLPHLKLEIDGDTYHVLTGKGVRNWKPGAVVEHVTTITVAQISGAR